MLQNTAYCTVAIPSWSWFAQWIMDALSLKKLIWLASFVATVCQHWDHIVDQPSCWPPSLSAYMDSYRDKRQTMRALSMHVHASGACIFRSFSHGSGEHCKALGTWLYYSTTCINYVCTLSRNGRLFTPAQFGQRRLESISIWIILYLLINCIAWGSKYACD